jgi:hypothetical protein
MSQFGARGAGNLEGARLTAQRGGVVHEILHTSGGGGVGGVGGVGGLGCRKRMTRTRGRGRTRRGGLAGNIGPATADVRRF